ncbi:MAG: NADH-quinone oxidoreductase subunit D [Acidimicrobiia bacterium]|nr:NADH-quinone oxidoreductase subunit D [Acidimicrobiia bacterium]
MFLPGETHRLELTRERGIVTEVPAGSEEQLSAPGDETMIINLGPQHPSTHGVLRLMMELDGEEVLRVKPVIGYLHTGMEKTAEDLMYIQGSTNVTRMDYLNPLGNELCFSLAVEQLLDLEVPPRAAAIRVLMAELCRINSHLIWFATSGMDLGATTVMIHGFRERELILRFFERTTGLRMNCDYIRPGGVAADLPDGWADDVAEITSVIPRRLDESRNLLDDNPIFRRRTQGVGILTREEAVALGATGPILRATGVAWDLRKAFPYSGYEQYDFEVPTHDDCDVWARYQVRVAEIYESARIVEQVIETMPAGDYRVQDKKVTPPPRHRIDTSMEALIHHFKLFTEGFKVPPGETYVAVESPKGELGCYLVSDGGARAYRQHTRGPCFYHVHAMPAMMVGGLVADAVLVIGSSDPVLGEVDR